MAELLTPEFERLQRLLSLREHPAWSELIEFYTLKEQEAATAIGRRILAGIPPIHTTEYERGYWDGIREILRQPGKAEKVLRPKEVRHSHG